MSELGALAVFSFVSAATPGPNNVLLWGSGMQFGLWRTTPHIAGTAAGIGTMAIAVGTGLGVLVTTVPAIEVGLKLAGSAYLLYLAVQVAGLRTVERSDVARPLGLLQAIAFQFINPKAWVFVLAATTTFRPDSLPGLVAVPAMAMTMAAVVTPSATLWAVGGSALSGLIARAGAGRAVSIALGVLLAATVVFIWL